jgi:heptosyltransferase-2
MRGNKPAAVAKAIQQATIRKPYLVRGLNWLGDAVMSIPSMAALARAGVPMKVVARKATGDIYKQLPMVSEVLLETRTFRGRLALVKRLLTLRFSGALLLTRSISSALIAFASLVPDRTGYACDFRGPLLSRAVKREPDDLLVHQSFGYLRLVESLGIPAPFTRPALIPGEPDPSFGLPGGFKLAIAPGAAYGGAKCWPAGYFAEAALKILANRPGTAVLLGGPGDAAKCKAVEEAMARGPKVLNLAGRTAITDLVSVLAKCHLTLANDSGIMHLSGALDVPVVGIFGPTNPMVSAPLSRRFSVLSKPVPCSPCFKRSCPRGKRICMDDLEPSLAVEAAESLLTPFQAGKGAIFWTPSLGDDLPEKSLPDDMRLVVVGARSYDLKEGLGGFGEGAPIPIGGGARTAAALDGQGAACPEKSPGPKSRLVILPKPESGEIDWASFLKAGGISAKSSIWIGDSIESVSPAARFGGRSVLIMTQRAKSELQAWRDLPSPTIVVPSSIRAAEWLKAMAT